MKTRILILGTVMLLSVASALAQSGTTGPLTWKISNDALTISGSGAMPDYECYSSSYATVPWYQYRSHITVIIIENGVTHIGDYAFFEHIYLTSITIPSSVTSIGHDVFEFCFKLTSIILPNGVTSIGYRAFACCDALTSITNYNPVPIVIDPIVFESVNQSACTLKVLISSVNAYKNAEVWKEFNIEGIGEGIEPVKVPAIKLYPNPTSGKITIKSPSLVGRPGGAISVFDITGRLVLEVNNIDNDETTIDLSNYADGVYFIKVGEQTVKVVKR